MCIYHISYVIFTSFVTIPQSALIKPRHKKHRGHQMAGKSRVNLKKKGKIIYSLVNVYITVENHHFNGKIPYFYGHFQ